MSYQVLARKWRPARFSELVGQEHAKTTLINALNQGRLHHAYLFTGTRGVGKTSIARIFAKSLNCESGVSAEPCGHCSACVDINAGTWVDLIEIDAASRTKVEDTREILDNVQYAPTRGRFKVYLIDEVHMLSRHSFNALLKTLEEPPEHVKFLLATTDPQKLPVTILSRCLQFNLKALTRTEISDQLAHILGHEQIACEAEGLDLLAKAAHGSMRDSLSLTDQAIAMANGTITAEVVHQMLGTIDKQWSRNILSAVLAEDNAAAFKAVHDLFEMSPDVKAVVDDMLAMLHLVAMAQITPEAASIAEDDVDFVVEMAQKADPAQVQLWYQILLNGKRDIALAPDLKTGFEMLMLRLLAFNPSTMNASAAHSSSNAGRVQSTTSIATSDQQATSPGDNLRAMLQQRVKTVAQPVKESATQTRPAAINDTAEQQPLSSQQVESAPVVTEQLTQADNNPLSQNQQTTDDAVMTRLNDEQSLLMQEASDHGLDTERLNQNDVSDQKATEQVADTQPHTPELSASADITPADSNSPPTEIHSQEQATDTFDDPLFAILANRDDMSQDEKKNDGVSRTAEKVATPVATPALKNASPERKVIQNTANQPADSMRQVDSVAESSVPLSQHVNSNVDAGHVEPSVITAANANSDDLPPWQIEEETFTQPVMPQSVETRQPEIQNTPVTQADVGQSQGYSSKKTSSLERFRNQHHINPSPHQLSQQPVESIASVNEQAPSFRTIGSNGQLVAADDSKTEVINVDDILGPSLSNMVDQWAAMIEQMGLGGLSRQLARNAVYQQQDSAIQLTIDENVRHLDSDMLSRQLSEALANYHGQPVTLSMVYQQNVQQTPALIQAQLDQQRLERAVQLVQQDDVVHLIQQRFAATLNSESVEPTRLNND